MWSARATSTDERSLREGSPPVAPGAPVWGEVSRTRFSQGVVRRRQLPVSVPDRVLDLLSDIVRPAPTKQSPNRWSAWSCCAAVPAMVGEGRPPATGSATAFACGDLIGRLRHHRANAPPAEMSSDGSRGARPASRRDRGCAVTNIRTVVKRQVRTSFVAKAPADRHRSVDPASNLEHKFHTSLSSDGPRWSRLTVLRMLGHEATNDDLWVRRCRWPAAVSLAPDVGVINSWSPRGALGAGSIRGFDGFPRTSRAWRGVQVCCRQGGLFT